MRIGGEKTVTVQVAKNYTVKMLNDTIVLNHLSDLPKKTKNIKKKSRVIFKDTITSDTPRKNVGTLGLKDWVCAELRLSQGVGDGKRGKPSTSEKEVLVFVKPEVKATDPPEIQKAVVCLCVCS